LLKKAYELKFQLAKSPGLSRLAFARQIAMDPAHLTRFLNLTALAPQIQRYISNMQPTIHRSLITDRDWHRLARIRDQDVQLAEFERLKNPMAAVPNTQEILQTSSAKSGPLAAALV
jgi:hypothetical protein